MNRLIEGPEYEVHAEVRVDPERIALLVVDVQNDFVHQGGGLLVPDARGNNSRAQGGRDEVGASASASNQKGEIR
jgi:nicotinamidase-related amidase